VGRGVQQPTNVTAAGVVQAALFLGVLTALTPVLGAYLQRVFEREPVALDRLAGPLERGLHRAIGSDPSHDQDWKEYARSAIVFSALCFGALYLTLRTQGIHPFNPQGFESGSWDVSFNTAVSFVSNTSWQFYAGETTLSNFSQMAGIAVHSFLSAAVGLATAIAVVRGFSRQSGAGVGNFWGDLVRSLLYVLVPIALLATLVMVSQGVVQSLGAPVAIGTLAGGEQTLVLGPVASQVAIKTMGSVGGGFFNVNSAMPLENATPFASFVQALLIVLIPAALTSTFGRMVGSRRQGWMLYAVMALLLTASIVAISAAEQHGSPALAAAGLEAPNLEGKEQRFGIDATALYAASTTGGASGAVNGAMEAFTGLGAAVPMANMMTGEVVFGGIGSGLSSMLLTVLLAVFIGGLMVGRTPEYLGKNIDAREMKLVLVGTLSVPLLTLICVALGVATAHGRASLFSDGSLGFSETLYAYVSQAFNNGSAFAGYTGYVQPNAPGNVGAFGITFADLLGGLAMLAGRYVPMIAALAVAGSLAGRRRSPSGAGTLRTDTAVFASLLIGTIALLALLDFVPALMLGPLVDGLEARVR
jgi:K+-transporting ATPase ATPase A chain